MSIPQFAAIMERLRLLEEKVSSLETAIAVKRAPGRPVGSKNKPTPPSIEGADDGL